MLLNTYNNLVISEFIPNFAEINRSIKMKPAKKRKSTGLLSELLSEISPSSMARTRNRMLVAAKIADAMHSMGMNQKQMAAAMQKTESEISEWLSGDRNFTIDTLTDIENFLHIRLVDTTVG
jgi:ribosome-binding protein aMBF1 (putative translation factor)